MLTQDEYKLWTGETVNYSDSDWQKIVIGAVLRLERFLCLEELPTDENGNLPEDFANLLANFIALSKDSQGAGSKVTSKRVRNFSINYSNDGDNLGIFARLEKNYGDIIAKYSACTSGLCVEKTARGCCGRF